MDPDEISKKADRERERVEKSSTQSKVKKEIKKKTYSSDSFYVYRKIYPSTFRLMLWIFFVATIGAVFIVVWLIDDVGLWSLYLGCGLTGLFIVRVFIEYMRKVFTYNTYKNFKQNLPFKLTGWEKLGTEAILLKAQNWAMDSSLEVIPLDGISTTDLKRINDALLLFNVNANNQFYKGEMGGDGRKKWDFNNVLKVTGSADIGVTGEMYKLIQVYLKSIHSKYPIIKEVKVFFGDKISEVEPYRSSVD